MILLQSTDSQIVRHALQELPVEFREVMVLREMEDLSYKEIADIVDVPHWHRHVAIGARAQTTASTARQTHEKGGTH